MNDEAQRNQLQQAVCAGNEDALMSALAAGFKVNAKDGFGQTLLMLAAEAGKEKITELLIAAKANLDTRDQFSYLDGGGKTALHRAVENRHVKVVNMLLDAGAKVDVVDKMARTPLEFAIGNKDLEIAETLLKAGANPNGSGKATTPDRKSVV